MGLSARRQPCLVGKEPLKPQFGSFEKRVRLKSDLGGRLLVIYNMLLVMGIGIIKGRCVE